MTAQMTSDYIYTQARANPSQRYLWPVVRAVIASTKFYDKRAIDLGCGNGTIENMGCDQGFDVVGIDNSQSGIAS